MSRKPIIAYTCSYFPDELVQSFGFEVLPLHELSLDDRGLVTKLPVNLCGFLRYCDKILDQLDIDGLVLANCCNASQRLYDIVRMQRPDLFCKIFEVPRDRTPSAYELYFSQIEELLFSMTQHFAIPYKKEGMELAVRPESATPALTLEDQTIYVFGSGISPELKEIVSEKLKPYPVAMNYCANRKNGNLLFANRFAQNPDGSFADEPCALSAHFLEWFKLFISKNRNKLAGVIYLSSRNCDHYLFSYPSVKRICREQKVPIIGIEEEYRNFSYGQISTRLEAFMECLEYSSEDAVVHQSESIGTTAVGHKHFRDSMKKVAGIVPGLSLSAIQLVVSNQIDLFADRLWTHPEKAIWTNMVMPVEVFYGADLVPVNMELAAGWSASLGLSQSFVSTSEGLGFGSGLCSYHKAAIGMLEEGQLPKPRAAVVSSHICDGGPGVANFLAEQYGTETFTINVPFHQTEMNNRYLRNQYENLIGWLECYCGYKIKKKRLIEALELSNQARDYWTKAMELRQGAPLMPGRFSLRNLFGATFLFGSELGVSVARAFYEQLLDLSRMSRTEDMGGKRILWIHFAPLYANRLMQYMEETLQCRIVMDVTGYMYWPRHDLDEPVDSLVSKTVAHFYLDEPIKRQALYRKLMEDYRIDGIVHFMHSGCRAIPGGSWLVRDLASEMRIPYLELSGDCIDPGGFSEEQMKLRLEAFSETLEGGGGYVSRN
ncbi:2-hydroxyacyl-CoA dehydratase family protein [Paenibacillus sp. M1]|uniref:2-hydroxyacyl-CoA dehydratase family protein n=1 Tax=Paenibacillus haidiansis TaxID=1574488 RepID=A0ABU7VQ77_9BACL